MKSAKMMSVLALSVILGGCAVGPNYHVPSTTMPSAYRETSALTPHPTTTVSPTTQPVDMALWWKSLGDPELDSLVDRAIASNDDLEIALTRLQEARTLEVAVTGYALPVIDATGTAARGSGTNSTKGRIGAPLNAASNTTGLKQITQIVGFDAAWELDIFGHYRREIEATGDDTQAAAEVRSAVLITVVSDVARAYMDTRALQLRLSIIQDNIRIEKQTVDLVQERFNRGLTNELDLALAKRQLSTLESEVSPLAEQVAVARRRVAVLLGQYPDELSAELRTPAALPDMPAQIQPGLPVDLLRRRPDIREAERELASSTALVGADEADLFPRVAFTAGAGLQGQWLGVQPPRGNTFIWSAGPMMYWPLLDFGTLDAKIDIQDLRTHEMLVNYKRTILNAVEEVENGISGYDAEQERLSHLSDALTASQRAVTLASERYDRGLTDFLNVLDAERQMYELQDQYAVAQEAVVLQFIAVYKGLGGGWETHQDIPAIHQPQPAIIATFSRMVAPKDPEK